MQYRNRNNMENQKKEKALDKIRKLLALVEDKGASQAEAENALRNAQRLMIKYGIEDYEIELSMNDIGQDFVGDCYRTGERRWYAWDLLYTIAEPYRVRILRNRYWDKEKNKKASQYRVIGDSVSRKIVIETFDKLLPFVRSLSKIRYKEYMQGLHQNHSDFELKRLFGAHVIERSKFLRDYMEGYMEGLSLKLKKDIQETLSPEDSEKWGLILVKKDDLIQSWIDTEIKGIKNVSSRQIYVNGDVLEIGKKDGSEQNATERLH